MTMDNSMYSDIYRSSAWRNYAMSTFLDFFWIFIGNVNRSKISTDAEESQQMQKPNRSRISTDAECQHMQGRTLCHLGCSQRMQNVNICREDPFVILDAVHRLPYLADHT